MDKKQTAVAYLIEQLLPKTLSAEQFYVTQEALKKERQQIEEAYQSGGRNALKYPRDYPRHVTKEEYFNQTYQNTQQNPELLTQ